MIIYKATDYAEIAKRLLNREVGVMPTDTIYGLHCIADNPMLSTRIYEIKQRPETMPFIILIPDLTYLGTLDIVLTPYIREVISQYWPGPNTLIFTTPDEKTYALRHPKNEFLINLLKLTGPLVSTSANPHGKPSALDVNTCIDYFGENVDFYVDGGQLNNPPSSIYKFSDESLEKIR